MSNLNPPKENYHSTQITLKIPKNISAEFLEVLSVGLDTLELRDTISNKAISNKTSLFIADLLEKYSIVSGQ